MIEKRIGIITDCVCDLPKSMLDERGIEMLYFLIKTDSGVFTDTDEITAENLLSYIDEGGEMAVSYAPSADTYVKAFRRMLKTCGEVIYITISSEVSAAHDRACEALMRLGDDKKRVHVFDSRNLSSGLGIMVIFAADMAESGASSDSILDVLTDLRERVSTTFITKNSDYLFFNGRISERVKRLIDLFSIHPVLELRNGRICMKKLFIGDFEKVCKRYLKYELKKPDTIDKRRIFITYVGCSVKKLAKIKQDIISTCTFDEILMTKACATVSCNCGSDTFGVIFVRNT